MGACRLVRRQPARAHALGHTGPLPPALPQLLPGRGASSPPGLAPPRLQGLLFPFGRRAGKTCMPLWEQFVLEQLSAHFHLRPQGCSFSPRGDCSLGGHAFHIDFTSWTVDFVLLFMQMLSYRIWVAFHFCQIAYFDFGRCAHNCAD